MAAQGNQGENIPDAEELANIRRFAADPVKVEITTTAKYDSMAVGLTVYDICDHIVACIDNKQRIKKVVMRGVHAGQAAFEFKPTIDDALFYIKVLLCDVGTFHEHMLVVSAHPDH